MRYSTTNIYFVQPLAGKGQQTRCAGCADILPEMRAVVAVTRRAEYYAWAAYSSTCEAPCVVGARAAHGLTFVCCLFAKISIPRGTGDSLTAPQFEASQKLDARYLETGRVLTAQREFAPLPTLPNRNKRRSLSITLRQRCSISQDYITRDASVFTIVELLLALLEAMSQRQTR